MVDFGVFKRLCGLSCQVATHRMIICSWFLLLVVPGISFTVAQKATVLKETCRVFTFRFVFFLEEEIDKNTVETIEKPQDASIKKLITFMSKPADCSKTKLDFHKYQYTKTSDFELTALLSFTIDPLDKNISTADRITTSILCSDAVNLRLTEQNLLRDALPLNIAGTVRKAAIVRAQTVSCCGIFYGFPSTINSCCKTDFKEEKGKCICPPGRFLDVNNTECKPCPEDTYQPKDGSSMCTSCPSRTTTYTNTGATSVSACRQACLPGERFNRMSKNCTQCPRNTYQPLLGQLECVPCPNNTSTNNIGSDKLDDCIQSCSPGSFYNSTSKSCESCPRNFHQQTAGQFNCIPCKESKITLKTGSNSEQDCILECQPGDFYDFSKATCRPCPLNHYQKPTGQLNCTRCPDNKITINISSTTIQDCIKNCSLGSLFNYTTQDCQKCPRNFFQSETGKTECSPCPDGKITNTPGAKFSNSCFKECRQGYFYDFNTTNCLPCPLRYYQNVVGQLSCIRCPDDKITINVSSTTVQDCITNCSSGSAFNFTTQDCQKCPLDFFQPQTGKTECTPCPDGKITSSPGAQFSNSCFKACEPGQFYNSSSNGCENCTINSYQELKGQKQCIPCQFGTITITVGSKNVKDCIPECDAGMKYDADSFECQLCPSDTYKPTRGETKCISCPTGRITYNKNNTKETDCAEECTVGKYFNTTSWTCIKCQRNSTQDNRGQTRCLACPDGKITEEEGTVFAMDCIKVCPSGEHYNKNQFNCDACPGGKYQPNEGTSSCLTCPGGKITFQNGAKSVQDCVKTCPPGSHHINRTEHCAPCDMDSYQNDYGQEICKRCPKDYKTLQIHSTNEKDCLAVCETGEYHDNITGTCVSCEKNTYQPSRRQFDCLPCPNGTLTLDTMSNSVDSCILDCQEGFFYNHTLKICVACPLGTYQWSKGQDNCHQCPDGQTTSNNGNQYKTACFLDCREGLYYNSTKNKCIQCSLGEYQPSSGQTRCLRCSIDQTTLEKGSSKSDACIKNCQRGSFYNKTLRDCLPCPRGKYQPSTGQVECKKCASVLTTYQLGSVDDSACNLGCSPGQYLNITASKCESCPPDTYQDLSDTTACKPCPNNTTTLKRETKVLEDCVFLQSTSSPKIDVIEIITIAVPAAGTIMVIVIVIICFLQRNKTMKSNDRRRMSAGALEANSSFTNSSPSFVRPKLDSDVSMANHHYKMEGSGLKPDVNLRPNSRTVNIPKSLQIPRENLIFVGEVLGKGNFGRVEKARLLRDGEETIVAVKMIKGGGSFTDEKELFDELEILASLFPHPHPNIVNLVGGSTFDDGPLFVAVEYCANGNLLKYLQRNQTRSKPKAEYVNILPKAPKPSIEYHWKLNKVLEICSGMVHLAKYKVIHRDVAARNVLLDGNWVAKISDFGMARDIYVQQIYRKDTEGFLPVRWMAIESLESFIYTSHSDVWSFGILMWEIITDGRVPYNNILDHNQLLNYIKSGRIMKRPKNCPKDYYNIMEKCWDKDPSTRPTFENLAREIQTIYDNELRKDEALPQRIFRKFSSRRKRKKPEGEDESKDGGLPSGKLRTQNTMGNSSSKKIDKIEEEQLFTADESPGNNTMSMQVLETPKHDQKFQEELDNKGYESSGSVTALNNPDVLKTELSERVEGNEKASSEVDSSKYSTDPVYGSLKHLSQNRKDSSSEQKSKESEPGNEAKDDDFSVGRENKVLDNAGFENIDDSPSNLASDLEPVAKVDKLVHDSNTRPTRGSQENLEKSSLLATDTETGISQSLAADESDDALSNNQVN